MNWPNVTIGEGGGHKTAKMHEQLKVANHSLLEQRRKKEKRREQENHMQSDWCKTQCTRGVAKTNCSKSMSTIIIQIKNRGGIERLFCTIKRRCGQTKAVRGEQARSPSVAGLGPTRTCVHLPYEEGKQTDGAPNCP